MTFKPSNISRYYPVDSGNQTISGFFHSACSAFLPMKRIRIPHSYLSDSTGFVVAARMNYFSFAFANAIFYIGPIKTDYCKKVAAMPVVSMFYGIIIYLYFQDTDKHHKPHIHARYQEHEAVISIADGSVLDGSIPAKKLGLVKAWITIHEDELHADWELAINGETIFKIDPLK